MFVVEQARQDSLVAVGWSAPKLCCHNEGDRPGVDTSASGDVERDKGRDRLERGSWELRVQNMGGRNGKRVAETESDWPT